MVKIRSEKLTTCHVAADGGEVALEFVDATGAAVKLEMPIEQAESLIMTLPQLLACALRQRTGDQDARYVFCSTSARIGQNQWNEERRISGSS